MVEEDSLLFFLNGEMLRFPRSRVVMGSQVSLAHAFNPSTEEAETDRYLGVSIVRPRLKQTDKNKELC